MRHAFAVALAVALAIGAAACGGGGESAQPSPPPPPPPAPQAPPPAPKKSIKTVRIVIQDGKPVGGLQHVTVSKNEKVALVVTSDVADEVHLHGYDKKTDAGSGKTAKIVFVASIPGRFEVELEDRGLQIVDLEVRP